MNTPPLQTRRSRPPAAPNGAAPAERLSEADLAWVVNVGRRLRAEFSALLGALPQHERSGPGLERLLGTHRAIAYRLISALAAPDDPELLTRIPGVEGLRKCTAAARRKLGPKVESLVAGTDSAIDDFQELIRAGGGSHARLVARIRATKHGLLNKSTTTPRGRREDVRRAMHDVVQALSGRSIDARTSVSIIRPNPETPDQFEYVHVRANIGYRAVSGGLPLVLASWVTVSDNTSGRMPGLDYCDLAGAILEGRETTGLLEPFCSSPLPLVTSRDTTGRLVQLLDQSRVEPGAAMNVVTGYRLPRVGKLPPLDDPPVFLESTNMVAPVDHLVADLYVHHSLTVGATPSLNLYLGRGTGGCDLVDRWHEQIEGAPVLGLLGRGLDNAHSPAWERHAELTRYVFDQLAWNPSDYVGFRCDERWPLWNCDYVMALDYRSRGETSPGR